MMLLSLLLAVTATQAQRVTPVEKVITLLANLVTEVQVEGKTEATNYDEYACFCKSTTEQKSDSITAGRDAIDSLAASIAEDTATKAEKTTELGERKTKHEELQTELAATQTRLAKEKAEYEAIAADLSKAIASLDGAMDSLESTKPVLLEVRKAVQVSIALADGMNLITEQKRKALTAFLQTSVDPSDPTYKYHSQGIIDMLKQLNVEFSNEKMQLDTEWEKAHKTLKDTISDLNMEIAANDAAMTQLTQDIDALAAKIATDRGTLVETEGVLKDDQLYLKDLTAQCEERAQDWDQRSAMRRDELAALTGALEVIQSKVKDADSDANKRALLQKIAPHTQSVAFVQEAATVNKAKDLLRASSKMSTQARVARVVALLKKESNRLSSPVLSALATKVQSDPFTKIKGLIQELIERLLAESTAEATKKGFCDTEIGKANKDRDFRMEDAKNLNIELQQLEIKKANLEAEISLLEDEIDELNTNLAEATTIREKEHSDNIDTMATAKGGYKAVKEAIQILQVFYKTAARRGAFVQYSPVDEDTSGPGFKGKYAGKQDASAGILGMLEVIKTDFERTLKTTQAAEDKSHAEFTEFDRTSKADIAGKETKHKLDTEDLETTDNTITEKMGDLQTAMDLLDSAIARLEELKPTCIDTGMSYAERVEKREAEMAALKNALCILDTDGVEAECGV